MRNTLFLLLLVLLAICAAKSTRAQETSINGTITDIAGATLPGAHITATPTNGGAAYSAITTGSGNFQIPSMTAADYTVRIDASGFTPVEEKVTLLVGQVISVSPKMMPAGNSSTVQVDAVQSEEISTTTSEVAGNVDAKEMQKIPLNGRNWMDLSQLIPGIRRNAITNYSPLGTLNGGRLQINVDGQQVTQNNSDSAFGQPQFSRDAIAQFQIITNRFDATLGRSSQIVINSQTKSGGNGLHGTAFGYFRNDVFNAADPIQRKVLPFSDQQYGATIGGPIRKDKLWYFVSYEGEHQPNTVDTTELGFTPVRTSSHSNTLLNNEYLGRIDYQRNDANHFFGRYYLYTTQQPYILDSGVASVSRAAKTHNTDNGFIVNWNRVISPNLVNQISVGFNYIIPETDPLITSMELRFPTTTIGAHYNYPSYLPEAATQFRDDVFWLKRKHSIKGGVEYILEKNDGSFPQNVNGTVSFSADPPLGFSATFPNELDPATWNLASLQGIATTYVQGFGPFKSHITQNTIGVWLQDDWKLAPRFTANLGLRYDNDIGVFTAAAVNINGVKGPTHGDNHEVSPRLGFAWDTTGHGRTVIRGGAGIYFADIVANQIFDAQIFNGQSTVQASVSGPPVNLSNPFGSQNTSLFTQNPQSVFQAIQVMNANVSTPWSAQASLGLQQAIGRNWTASADLTFNRVHHDWVRGDANLLLDPATGFNQVSIGAVSAKCPHGCISSPVRPNPHYSNILTFYTPSGVGSIYKGAQAGVQKRTSYGVTAGTAYTYGLQKDNSSGPFTFPNNPYNYNSEWANSVDDQRHTLSVNADYQYKWGIRSGLLYHYGSGLAYTTVAGGVVPTALGSTSINRSFCFVGASSPALDASGSLPGSVCSHISPGSYIKRLFDPAARDHYDSLTGLTTTDRNQLRGTPVERVDANLAKVFTIRERFHVTTMVEAFNLFNHPNYGNFSPVVTFASYGSPAFSNYLAYYARMLQFSGRIDF